MIRKMTRCLEMTFAVPILYLLFSVNVAFADPQPTSAIVNITRNQPVNPKADGALAVILNSHLPSNHNFRTYSSGVYAGDWFWMDNHRLIFWTYEASRLAKDAITQDLSRFLGPKVTEKHHLYPHSLSVTKFWDIDRGKITQYRLGSVGCYADGTIDIGVPGSPETAWKTWTFQLAIGSLGQEKVVDRKDRSRWYMYLGECGDEPSAITRQYMDSHPDEYVKPLRKEDGFIVLGKHNNGTRGPAFPQDFVTYYRAGSSLVILPLYNNVEALNLGDYFPFAKSYIFTSSKAHSGKKSRNQTIPYATNSLPANYVPSIYLLRADGLLKKIKVPDYFLNRSGISSAFLSRLGMVWTVNAIFSHEPGIYLSHGEDVEKISHDSVEKAKMSPDGCRLAYEQLERNQYELNGQLKVVNLCEGSQEQ